MEQKHKPETKTEETADLVDAKKIGETAVKGEEIKADLDDLLDEIDGVLESNAEEFVQNYIQKGGQ